MNIYSRRLQTIPTEEQYQSLGQLSARTGKPISMLIREAVENTCFEQVGRVECVAAAKRLIAMNAPAADWPQMEAEIIEGALK
ncbi:MAG: ribbon-helix-helix domain-containing protein [Anaerolineae bacterium]